MTYHPSAQNFLKIAYGDACMAIDAANKSISIMNLWPDCEEKRRRVRETNMAIDQIKITRTHHKPVM